MTKIVCICGTNEITRNLVDWTLPADFWVFNESAYVGNDPTRWTYNKPITGVFQMHVPQIWRSDNGGHYPGYYEKYLKQKQPYPIWMIEKFEDVPSAEPYPKDEITRELLAGFTDEKNAVIEYYTSSAAYAIALAIYKKYDEIRLFGIEALSGTEYVRQKAGIAFWMALALGRGIKVIRQSRSLLLNETLYGYTGEIMIAKQKFELAAAQLERETKRTETEMFEAQGKTKALLKAMSETQSQSEANKLYDNFLKALNDAQEKVFNYGLLAGRLGENRRYIAECDELINAAGGEMALRALQA